MSAILRDMVEIVISNYSNSLNTFLANTNSSKYKYLTYGQTISVNKSGTFKLQGVVTREIDKAKIIRIIEHIKPGVDELKIALVDYTFDIINEHNCAKFDFITSKLNFISQILNRNLDYFKIQLASNIDFQVEKYESCDSRLYEVLDKTSLYRSLAKHEYNKLKGVFDLALNDKDSLALQLVMYQQSMNLKRQDDIQFVKPINFSLIDASNASGFNRNQLPVKSLSELISKALQVFEIERMLALPLYGECLAEKNAREAITKALIKQEEREQEKASRSKAHLQNRRRKNYNPAEHAPKPSKKSNERISQSASTTEQIERVDVNTNRPQIKIDWRVLRWKRRKNEDDNILANRISEFNNKGDDYASLTNEQILYEWKKHNLSGLEQMLTFSSYEGLYYFRTKNEGYSCFAHLVSPMDDGTEVVKYGHIDFGVDENGVVYHMLFRDTKVINRSIDQIHRPMFENLLTNIELEENLNTWDDVGSSSLREESGALIFRITGENHYYRILSKIAV